MKIKVLIKGKIFDNHSLAIVNRNLVYELSKNESLDVGVYALDMFNPSNKLSSEEINMLKPALQKRHDDPDVEIRHFYPPDWTWPLNAKTKVIYIQPWEYMKIPFEWQYKFENFADHLIVPSNWTANAFLVSGLNPKSLSIVPNGYNPNIFKKEGTQSKLLDPANFTFTYVGCSQYRKGIDILLNSWKDCFVKADRVQLFIKDTPAIYGITSLLDEIIKLQYRTNCAKIIYNDDNLSAVEIADLYRGSDILVHPYRAEGFGMHVQEAMACGAFPLVTGGGSTDDFVTEDCGLKINSVKNFMDITNQNIFVGKPGDSYSLMGAHSWVIEPESHDLINKMRFLYHHHEKKTVLDKVNNAKLFNWSNVGQQYTKIIESIAVINEPRRFK